MFHPLRKSCERNLLGNLTINGETSGLQEFEYVFFVPASIVGNDFSHFVHGANTVSNPVLGDPGAGERNFAEMNPMEWTLNPDWINDSIGNTGLFVMIDLIVGIDSSQRSSSIEWENIALYFQRFFAKYYKSYSTMFGSVMNVMSATLGDGSLGYS